MARIVRLGAAGLLLILFVTVVGLRIPAVEDRLFDEALQRNFSPRSAALLEKDGLNVFLCGTGSPLPSARRAQNCTAVFAGGRYFLVDSGTGSWENVQAAGVPGDRLAGILLTHFHSDHIGDIGEADLGSWVAGRQGPLAIHGPEGVDRIVRGLNEEFELDHHYRNAHHGDGIADLRSAGLVAHEFRGDAAAVVLEADGLKITAFPVRHDPIRPAVGYRFDYQGRSVVISGDTAYSGGVVEAARGADLLIHEAQANHMVAKMAAAAGERGNTRLQKILGDIPSYHTSPEDAARAANEAGVPWLVLSHLTPAPDNAIAQRIFMRGVRKVRPNGVRLGEDRMAVLMPQSGGVEFEKY